MTDETENAASVTEQGKGPSKKAMKKQAKEAEKVAKKAEKQVTSAQGDGGDQPDISEGRYGVLPLITSIEKPDRTLVRIGSLGKGPSKKAMKKQAKEAEKVAKKAEKQVTSAQGDGGDQPDISEGRYGVLPLITSIEKPDRTLVRIGSLVM
ncbi:unnamed protein product [Notodromas monacha]|uniref:Uncharacterized protein n=1 Tax=Notodromas monacha TaxID=399045 RepID=A0A7R9BIE0_9CRUS|nr:unnamed protein product [Notodromas monacha]CAG0915207.1 unnamed protein product [Notodromas monacha]